MIVLADADYHDIGSGRTRERVREWLERIGERRGARSRDARSSEGVDARSGALERSAGPRFPVSRTNRHSSTGPKYERNLSCDGQAGL